MRWCFFSPGDRSLRALEGDTRDSGGAEAQIARLAIALRNRGHEVSLIHGDGRAGSARLYRRGIDCIDAAPSWRHPSSIHRFCRTVTALSPDVLYARLPCDFLWLAGMIVRYRLRARFLYALAHDDHCRGWTAFDHKRWFHGPLHVAGLASAGSILVQHSRQMQLLPVYFRHGHVLIPNLLDRASEEPRDFEAARYDAIWIGMIRPEKRLDIFLDQAARLPHLRFAVVGGFDRFIEKRIKSALSARLAGLANVIHLGALDHDHVLAQLRLARSLVNTSSGEGFPNTMLEAWGQGVPVLSLSVDPGGVLESEGIGRLCKDADTLRNEIVRLATSADLNRDMGTRGLGYVRRHHAVDAVCTALERAAAVTRGRALRAPAGRGANTTEP